MINIGLFNGNHYLCAIIIKYISSFRDLYLIFNMSRKIIPEFQTHKQGNETV